MRSEKGEGVERRVIEKERERNKKETYLGQAGGIAAVL